MQKSYRIRIVLVGCLLFYSWAGIAAVPIPDPPEITADAYILQDFNSGKIIAASNIEEPIEPASITKIMTAYIIFDRLQKGLLSFQDEVRISEKAWRNPDVPGWMRGSRMFADVGTLVKVDDLLHGLIVQSGNDATVALAEHVAGSEKQFADMMNEYAQRLGLTNTHFKNSTGWPAENHFSTVRDIAALSRALIQDFPDFYHLFAQKNFTYNNISQANRNTLLWKDSSVDGIKTGLTESAGYCIAASAKRDNMRLIAVIIGAENENMRVKSTMSLMDYGFRFYETHKLFAAGDVLRESRIWKGSDELLPLGLAQDLYVTIPRGEYQKLTPVMSVKKSIFAPVAKKQPLGQIEIGLNGEIIDQQPLVALKAVERGNLIQRMMDHVYYLMQ